MKIQFSKMGMAAALGARVCSPANDVQTNETSREKPVIEQGVSTDHGFEQGLRRAGVDDETLTSSATIHFPAVQEWDGPAERRFHDLAVAEAMQQLTREQAVELERLTRLRTEAADATKSLDEILLEIRQWKATVSLLSQLSNYVRVIGPGTKSPS